jgi:hypothetical protein
VTAPDDPLDTARERLAHAHNRSGDPTESGRREAQTTAISAVGLALCDIAESLRIIAGKTP